MAAEDVDVEASASRPPRRASSGLSAGSILFSIMSLLLSILVSWPGTPWSLWLIAVTEVYEDECTFGEGIWSTNVRYGSDVLSFQSGSKDASCDVPGKSVSVDGHLPPPVDAVDEFCSGAPGERPDETGMCAVTRLGRVLSALGIVLGATSFWFAAWRTNGRYAMYAATMTATVHIWLIALMSRSSLFSIDHWTALGKGNVVSYRGLGCVFQSPFMNGIGGLLSSHPLKCLYPGPALPLLCSAACFQLLAAALLYANVSSAGQQQQAQTTSKSYSLHGALMRRLASYGKYERAVLGLVLPLACLGQAGLLIAWFYHGMQFLVHTKVHDAAAPPSVPIGITLFDLSFQVFSFDPVTSLRDFWVSGGYFLAIISGFWIDVFPFFKVVLLLAFYFCPATELSRGRVLTWIDYLGKWSVTAIFCLTLIGIAFSFDSRISIPLPVPGLGHRSVAVDISVQYVPGQGTDWFWLAIFWTIGLGNVALELHTRARRWEDEEAVAAAASTSLPVVAAAVASVAINSAEPTESLSNHVHTFLSTRHVITPAGRVAVWAAWAAAVVATAFSAVLPSLIVTRSGAVGSYLVGGESRQVEMSPISLTRDMVHFGGPTRPVALSIVFALFAVALPLLHLVSLAATWSAKVSAAHQERLFRLCEVLDSWAALDVYLMACLMVRLGVRTISKQFVEQVVPGLTHAIAHLVPQEPSVMVLEASLATPGLCALVSAIALKLALTHLVMSLAAVAIAQRTAVLSTDSYHQASLLHEDRIYSPHVTPAAALSPETLQLFSPANRYPVAASATQMYAGIPLMAWRAAKSLGWIREAI